MTGIASSDIHKAIVSLWNTSGLDSVFNTYWSSSDRSKFPVLNDQEATPTQPFPYCVFEQEVGTTIVGMSGDDSINRMEVREIPWLFRIHAKSTAAKTAKVIAVDLGEEIMKVFGGHPSQTPSNLSLTSGNFLLMNYLNDYGIRTDDTNYEWIIRYSIIIDVPVAL